MSDLLTHHPCLSLPFTILAEGDTVRLVAGEDFRYTLTGRGLSAWLPRLLAGCDGAQSLAVLLANLDEPLRPAARDLVERLYGERVLVDGPAARAHQAADCSLVVEGTGQLANAIRDHLVTPEAGASLLPVLAQDRLDHDEALRFNLWQREARSAWLWVTQGPMSRGYVGPVFLPDAGPCLACLLGRFETLSPAPEFHRALIEHARAGGVIPPVPFPREATAVLRDLVLWKVRLLAESDPPPALYRLHVLEVDTLEVTSHRLFIDPECPACGRGL
jgi:bacteriocin biosynthesis cyclodehydratase domain-containing protein